MKFSPNQRSEMAFALNYFALFSVFGVVTPYFQKLLYAQGFHEQQIGLIFAAFETVGILTPPLWGWLADRWHRRRLVLSTAIACSALVFLSFGAIETFGLAMIASAFFGFFYRPVIPLVDGLVLRHLARHGGDYGRPRAAGSVSFILIILVAEEIGVAGDNARAIILGSAFVCSLAHVACVWFLPRSEDPMEEKGGDTPEGKEPGWGLLFSRAFILFAIVAFLARLGMTGYYGFFTLYLQNEIGYAEAGRIWVLGPLSEIPVIFFSTFLVTRLGVRRMVGLGILAGAIRLTGLAIAPSIGWIVPLQFLHALTFGAFHTASIHYIHRLMPTHMKQRATAVFAAFAFGLSAIVGNAVGGMMVYHLGYRSMYLVYGGVSVVALFVLMLFVEKPARTAAP